ncbi:MAG: hypothetical protein ACXWIN_08900 [Burkholderiaceae bacterium]
MRVLPQQWARNHQAALAGLVPVVLEVWEAAVSEPVARVVRE